MLIAAAASVTEEALASASAEPCPDIAVAFARGTGEPPGVGFVGQAFVDALRAQAGGRTVGVHGVNYPASSNFADSLEFRSNVVDGIRDEADHVQGVLTVCPNSRMVLGGYSQGAAATVDLSTLKGPLLLNGRGSFGGRTTSFQGTASATPDQLENLAGLLNLIGPPVGKGTVSLDFTH